MVAMAWIRVGAALIAAIFVAYACGGDAFEGSAANTGAGAAGESLGGAAGTGAGAAGAPGSGGSAGSGGTDSVPDVCSLPPDVGPCDGAFERYYFDEESGECRTFSYGGCQGNENNFGTLSECDETCRDDLPPTPLDACTLPTDCRRMPKACCAPCDPGALLSDFIAVRSEHTGEYRRRRGCEQIACEPCPEPEPGTAIEQNFVATCAEERCSMLDIREHELSACEVNADCVLRAGLDCCERCAADIHDQVAVRRTASLNQLLCGQDVACPPCVPQPVPGAMAMCGPNGHCIVHYESGSAEP